MEDRPFDRLYRNMPKELGLIDFQRNYRFSSGDLAGWDGRLLIIQSDEDPGVGKETSAALAAVYPQVRFKMLYGGGHLPSLSRKDEHLALIKDFLETA